MRDCRTSDDRLFAFVDGLETDLETHVATCEYCQDFLAELWVGELRTDLSDSVLQRIRFDEFLREVGQLTLDVAGAMGRALIEYGPGRDTTHPESIVDDNGDVNTGKLLSSEDDEE